MRAMARRSVLAQRMEHHGLVHPVDEFRPEVLGHDFHDRVLHFW